MVWNENINADEDPNKIWFKIENCICYNDKGYFVCTSGLKFYIYLLIYCHCQAVKVTFVSSES